MDPIEPQINEVILKQKDEWLYFSNPHQVISVRALEGVIPALREVERLTQAGGWHAAGYLSYEAATAFDKALQTHPESDFPHLWFGLYSTPRLITLPEPDSPKQTLDWLPNTDRDSYNTSMEKIRGHIANGRTYQVNYTMRLKAETRVDPWNFFLHLSQAQNNHAAYIDTGQFAIASASPELFFHLDGDTITCRPMKGTVKRGRTTREDRENALWLLNSEKNRAENIMIVDMIRNDLGRIARIGSVHVPELFTTEKYPTLWQMTSTVKAGTSASLTQIFKALFPCASITGAPKVSTMRIISELEITPRRIYTGTIGHISPSRKATFNVAIRTALIDRVTQTMEYGVGGGVVWDSTSANEYAEALLKARVLTESPPASGFSLLETMLWTPEEGYFLLGKHIARLLDSAAYFEFSISSDQIKEYLDQISSKFHYPHRVRLLLDKNGNITSEATAFHLSKKKSPLRVHLAKEHINSENVFLFHKTTYREMYDSARKDFPDFVDVLLYNENDELTEFTIGNLIVEIDGKLFTPPVSCGLLAGTFRAHLLESGQVVERIVPIDDLGKCSKVMMVNSIRKWQKVELNR